MKAESTQALEMRISLSEEEIDKLQSAIVDGKVLVNLPRNDFQMRPLSIVIAEINPRILLTSYPPGADVCSQRCYKIEISEFAYVDLIVHGYSHDMDRTGPKIKIVDEKRLRLCGLYGI